MEQSNNINSNNNNSIKFFNNKHNNNNTPYISETISLNEQLCIIKSCIVVPGYGKLEETLDLHNTSILHRDPISTKHY
jgi:hypothetical protein